MVRVQTVAIICFGIYFSGISLFWLLFVIVAGFTVVATLLFFHQDKLLYLPRAAAPYVTPESNPANYRNPGERSLEYEDVYIKTKDNVKLHCWFIKNSKSYYDAPTLLYFHANAGNMGLRMDIIVKFCSILKCNVFIVSYRGYGNSEGEPSEAGLELDAEAAMDHLLGRSDIDLNKLFVYGASLGGAVLISLISKPIGARFCGAIIENTFVNISEMADSLFPIFSPIKKLILNINWPSIDRIKKTKTSILFISGRMDELVPSNHMDRLYLAAMSSNDSLVFKFKEIEKGTHNDTLICSEEAISSMFVFMQDMMAKRI